MILSVLIARILYCCLTLYMLLILARWLGPYLELDFYDTRLRWIAKAVDPLLRFIRKSLPPFGPFDVGPVAALGAIWIIREVAVRMIAPTIL